ncbi:MAG: branched-chain amino acid ABC transporter substrate-binding protein, partial [Holosporales bacterium]
PYVFRYCGRDDKQGPVAAGYIAKHYKNKKIALVHDKSAYGKGLADAVQGALRKAGLQEVFYEAITAGERDFTPLITRLKRDKVGVLFIGGYYVEAALIKRQAADQGLDLVLVAGDSLVTSEYWGITKDAGANTFMTFAPDPRNISAASDTVKDFRAIGYEPEGYTLVNYAVIETWAAAVRSAGSVSADKVQVALKKESFDTILGSATFDAKGDNIGAQFIVYRWANGAYSPVNDAD